jgi:PTS system glucitol/sorbitol-specific IIC component
MTHYRTVVVKHGNSGWGGPIKITPTDEKKYIVSMTGMSIDKVAKQLAEMTGGELVNAFKKNVPSEQMAAIVINCGGVGRCYQYPKIKVPTLQTLPFSPSGSHKEEVSPSFLVTDVNIKCLELMDIEAEG